MFKSLHFKSFLLFMLAMFIGGVNSAWAQTADVTYDFTGSGWSASNGTLTNGTVSFTGQGGANFKMNTGYFMLGKKDAYINFPIYSSPVEKIVVTGRSGASSGVEQNIYVGSTAVSTTTTGATGTNTYEIASAYQAAGTQYTLKVTSAHNTQITKIEVFFASASGSVATPTFNIAGGVYTGTQSVELSCTTAGASIYYTTDGSTPDNNSTQYSAAIPVTETTTIKAIAYAGTDASSVATATYTIIQHAGTEADPYSVADANAVTPSSGTSDNVYIKGIVYKFYNTDIVSDGTNYRYYISDDGTETGKLLVYKGNGLNNVTFSSADDLQLGDEVVILGKLTTYNNAPEVAANNYIVSLQRKTLSSITLSGTYATSFVEGSEFNHEGVVVTATYSDQTFADVTELATFTEPDMTQVGDKDVTVSYGNQTASYTITITALPTYTATFSVNGTTSTENFKEGAAITFPSVTAPTGYTFMGWTETAISTTQETAPADLTSSATMGNADVTYYAVFAVGTGSAPSLTKMVSGDTFTVGDKVVIVADVDETTSYGLYQQTISNSYVMNFVFDNSVTTIADDDKNYLTVSSGSDGKWKLGDDTNGYLYNSSSNNLAVSTESATEWKLEDNEDDTFSLMGERYLSCRTDLSGDNANRWRMAGSSPAGVYDLAIYKFVDGNTSYSDYFTTIPTTVAITITAARAASFSTTFPLDFTGVEGITAYAATLKTDKYVHLDPVTTIPSGEGIIVKGAQGTYNVPVATGEVTLDCSEENLLKGTATEAKVISKDEAATERFYKYVQSTESGKVGFQKVLSTASEEKRTCAKGRAYLELTDEQQARFIGFADEEGGIATGINAIDNSQLTIDNDAPAYNLAGQKVGKGYKGIVVKNGKKYVK